MPVTWKVLSVDRGGAEPQVHLEGAPIWNIIWNDIDPSSGDKPDKFLATISLNKVFGNITLVPGMVLISAPESSDWLKGVEPSNYQNKFTPDSGASGASGLLGVVVPRAAPDYTYGMRRDVSLFVEVNGVTYFKWSVVSNLNNHAQFYAVVADSAGEWDLRQKIIYGFAGLDAEVQILYSEYLVDPRELERLAAEAKLMTAGKVKPYHPYDQEFEQSAMTEWVTKIPPIGFVPPLMESDSYTLLGYVALSLPPQSIQIRREQNLEAVPIVRSDGTHKSPLASSVHDWQINFTVTGEQINTVLVPLLRQIDRCPFLPIINLVFNAAGIFEVAVENVGVTTVQDAPNTVQVTLAGRKFDTKGLGFIYPFGAQFNWPLFKLYTDYLPRFVPVSLPMNGKVQIWSLSDNALAQIIDTYFEDVSITDKLGFIPAGASEEIHMPLDLSTNRGVAQVAILPIPSEPNMVGRYEVVMVKSPDILLHLLRAVRSGLVPGLEARSVRVGSDGVYLSPDIIPNEKLDRIIADLSKRTLRGYTDSIAIAWRLDSRGPVDVSQLDSATSRMLDTAFTIARESDSSGSSASGPVSSGVGRTEKVMERVALIPDDVHIVWQSVSVEFGHRIAILRRDVGDPIMQLVGRADTTLVLSGVTDEYGVSVLRQVFDRFLTITYLLRGLSFLRPLDIALTVENEFATLMGVRQAIPLNMTVQTLEGAPGSYQVTLSFVSFEPMGVQRQTLRRISDPVGRAETSYTFTSSGVEHAREMDRLTQSLRRSELYPDLRLPSYGVLLSWCDALAYDTDNPVRDFVVESLRGLCVGLEPEAFYRYLDEVKREMRRFLINNTALRRRLEERREVYADPDFYFHDSDGLSSKFRELIDRELGRGGTGGVVYQDNSGISASVTYGRGSAEFNIHDTVSAREQAIQEGNRWLLTEYPWLRHLNDMTLPSPLSNSDPNYDLQAAEALQSYQDLSNRFRDAYAIPQRQTFTRYRYSFKDTSGAIQVQQAESEAIDRLRGVVTQNRVPPPSDTTNVPTSPSLTVPAEPTEADVPSPSGERMLFVVSSIEDGLRRNSYDAVRQLVLQAQRGDSQFAVTNAATDPTNPTRWTVRWIPSAGRAKIARNLILTGQRILPALVMGMWRQESGFNSQARSRASAVGVAQFIPKTWNGLLQQSGRYVVSRMRGAAPASPERWDLASLVSLFYLIELTADALYNAQNSRDKSLWRMMQKYLGTNASTAAEAMLSEAAVKRALMLGVNLYNTGPGALRIVLGQLTSNVDRGLSEADGGLFAAGRTDSQHGRRVYQKYQEELARRSVGASGFLQYPAPSMLSRLPDPASSPVQPENVPMPRIDNAAHSEEARGDPFWDDHTTANFPLLQVTGWSQHVRHQPHGRLLQCFPSVCLLLVQGGRWVRWVRLWDHFYGLFSISSVDVHRSRDNPQHTAEIVLGNAYRMLSNMAVTQAFAQATIAGMRPFQYEQGEELLRGSYGATTDFVRQLVKSIQNSLFPLIGDYERHVWNQEMKALFLHPGERIHLRMGYGADASVLPVVFNGTIASVDIQGAVVRVLALGDGRELLRDIAVEGQPYKNSNLLGQTIEARNILIDILASRRAESIPVLGPMIYTFSLGGLLNDSRFGIESFGRIETLSGMSAANDAASGRWSFYSYKMLGMLSFQASEGEVGVNIYNSQRDSTNTSYGMLPLLDTLTLGLSQMAHNGDFMTIELKRGTTWDVIRNCQLAVLDMIASVEPFGLRSTLYFGRPHQAYHYEYYDGDQIAALGIPDIRTHISIGRYWRIMKFRQFRQYHVAISAWNLISNELHATSERMWNEAQVFDAEGVPGNKFVFDPAIVPEERRTYTFNSALSTTLMSQLSLGAESNWLSAIARIGIIRNLIGERLGIAMPLRVVNNAAANLVCEGISLMYDGTLVLLGASEIKPHDILFIDDELRAMHGPVVVREVNHHFSVDHGYTTVVVPAACAIGVGDLDHITLAQARQQFMQMLVAIHFRRESIIIYRGYLASLLWAANLAVSRIGWLIGKINRVLPKGAAASIQKWFNLLGTLSRVVRPSAKDGVWLVGRIVSAVAVNSKVFFDTLFQNAWTVESVRKLFMETVTDLSDLGRMIVSRGGNIDQVVAKLGSILHRLGGLGAARPVLSLKSIGSAFGKLVTRSVGTALVIGGTVLEMINRHLSGYYPCRLYPVRVNDLPLTAGIRGHFGTVQGDSISPTQFLLDAVTMSPSIRISESPPLMKTLGEILSVIWPLRRPTPAAPRQAYEAQLQPEVDTPIQNYYDTIQIIGSVDETVNALPPSIRSGTRRPQPFQRNTVSYRRNDPVEKGDALIELMHPQVRPIIDKLLKRLRAKGVEIAIHQSTRTLEQQAALYAKYKDRAVAKPSPNAPHVSGRAIDVMYRYPDGSWSSRPPSGQEQVILSVVDQMNQELNGTGYKVRWLGDRSKYKGKLHEPWHFDVILPGG